MLSKHKQNSVVDNFMGTLFVAKFEVKTFPFASMFLSNSLPLVKTSEKLLFNSNRWQKGFLYTTETNIKDALLKDAGSIKWEFGLRELKGLECRSYGFST
jgi:hypothetical protein